MGYYSDYNLDIVDGDLTAEQLKPVIVELSGYTGWWIEDDNSLSLYEAKWYDYADHMRKLSNKFPNVKFELMCEGEDGRRWIIDAFNGDTDYREGIVVYAERTLW